MTNEQESTIPGGVGGLRHRVFTQSWEMSFGEVLDLDPELDPDPVSEWEDYNAYLVNGEGYVPHKRDPYSPNISGEVFRWVQIVNDNNSRERVICTIMLAFAPTSPARDFWDFPLSMFAVHRRKGCPPNPADMAYAAYVWMSREELLYHERPIRKEDEVHYEPISEPGGEFEEKYLESGAPEKLVSSLPVRSEDSIARWDKVEEWKRRPNFRDVRPVGIGKEFRPLSSLPAEDEFSDLIIRAHVWKFPGLTIGSGKLAQALIKLRKAGVQQVPLSLLRKVVQEQAKRTKG